MNLTDEHLEVAFAAWSAAQTGGGVVAGIDHFVEAHDLAERGWLERRFVNDELAWYWTPQAETALLGAALTNVEGRQN